MILSSTSDLVSSTFLLNFDNTVNYEKLSMLVWQLEDSFSTAHTNLCDWLRMLCLRASDHVSIGISQVMTGQNEFIYTVFQHYDYYTVLIFLVEYYITFLQYSSSSTNIYHAGLWGQTNFNQNLISQFRKRNMNSALYRTAFKYMQSIIHLVVCLTTGPKPFPKQALHIG